MLRSLLWIEFRSTWWWWLLALVPLAVVRQFPGEETTRLSLTCLEPIAAG